MNRRLLLLFLFFSLVASIGWAAQAQTTQPAFSFVDPQAADKADTREDELYKDATETLNNGDYEQASAKFDQVVKMHGRRADAALYWKAYALNQAGNKGQALTTIAEFKKSYPQSRYMRDALALEVEIKGAAINPSDLPDEETRLIALNALMNSDPEKAVPLLDKVIHGNYSPKLKEKALFVLSQSDSDKAQQILLSIAKANNDPDLQKRAIRNLGMNGNSRNRAALKEIYNGASDPNVKKAVFQGWLMSGDKEDVLAVAQQEKSPELRKEAIRYLGIMGGHAEIRQLYKQTTDVETKEALLQAMGVGGDVQGMTEVAQTDKDPEVRRRAVRNLGIFGGSRARDTLISVYNSQADVETKKEVVNALFLNGAAKQMVELARKETNPELKKTLVQKMSLMKSPEITEYMMEILNK